MAAPIEMIRGSERITVYDDRKADSLKIDGWQRVSDLPKDKQDELRNRPPLPFAGYDDMGVGDVLANAQGLPPERVDEVVRYESLTKGRVSIINKLMGRTNVDATQEQPPVTVETVDAEPLKTTETVEIVPAKSPKAKG